MSSDSTRDRSMERLLRTQLGAERNRLAPVTDDCVDAETLAAWSDRTLPAEALQRVDAHLADCVRCQSLLATFAQTAPMVHAAAPFWQRWTMRWIVPIAAVGTAGIALVIWTSTRQRAALPTTPATQVAQAPPPPQVIVPPVPPTVVPESALGAARPKLQAQLKDVAAAKKPDAQTERRAETIVPAPAQTPPVTAPPPPPASGAAAAAQVRTNPTGVMLDAVSVAENKISSAVIAEFAAGAKAEAAVTSTLVAGGSVGAGGGGGGGRGAGGGRGGGGGARPATPPPSQAGAARQSEIVLSGVRWRIHLDSSVEKSTTGGASWDRINFDPPNPPVTAGVAPTADVCWLIGRNGLVLKTIDGTKFTPLTFPEPVNLRSIVARDAQLATVTTTDGRTFTTVNGGISWNPGLQGFSAPPF